MKILRVSLFVTVLLLVSLLQAQNWSGILAPARAMNWSNAGVPGGIPNRTTICSSLTSTATSSAINAAIASCASAGGGVVSLGAGTYSNATSGFCITGNNVTVRGAGANQTILAPTSGSSCNGLPSSAGMSSSDDNYSGNISNGPVAVSGTVTQGSTTITLASVPNLVVGNPIILDQLDSTADVGAVTVTQADSAQSGAVSPGTNGPYSIKGSNTVGMRCASASSPANCYSQEQIVTVTQCDGVTTVGHACASGSNISISPGLHMANWSTSNGMSAWWATHPISMDGIEDMEINSANNTALGTYGVGIIIDNCTGCWVKGVMSSTTEESHVHLQYALQATVRDSYFFLTQNTVTISYGIEPYSCSDCLFENNIFHAVVAPVMFNSSTVGSVIGYNFAINEYYTGSSVYNALCFDEHSSGISLNLFEGNICNGHTPDAIHGVADLNTDFRNYFSQNANPVCYSSGTGGAAGYATATYAPCTSAMAPIQIYAYHRFYNLIGNVLGTTGINTVYNASSNNNNSPVLYLGFGNGSVPNDSAVGRTIMLWGNADPVTGWSSPRFNSTEVPSGLTGTQAAYANPVPTNNTLPASFYYTSTPSWWPSSKPFPIIGPDITTGNLLACAGGNFPLALVTNSSGCTGSGASSAQAAGGHAYSNPAMDCYLNVMNGPPNGVTTGALSFNRASCYSSSGSAPAPPSGLTATVH